MPKAKKKGLEEEADDDEFTTVGKGGKTVLYTAEGIFKNLQAVQEARGKKVCPLYLVDIPDLICSAEHRSS